MIFPICPFVLFCIDCFLLFLIFPFSALYSAFVLGRRIGRYNNNFLSASPTDAPLHCLSAYHPLKSHPKTHSYPGQHMLSIDPSSPYCHLFPKLENLFCPKFLSRWQPFRGGLTADKENKLEKNLM